MGVIAEGVVKELVEFREQMDEASKVVGELIDRYTGDGADAEKLKEDFEAWKAKHGVSDEAGDEVLGIIIGWI